MLGDRKYDPPVFIERSMHLHECFLVILDMFEDIKRQDEIELIQERQPACIHLEEVRIRYPLARKIQALQIQVAS